MTKAHILDEIRRTAAANGGEAIGLRRFEVETGIKLGDWSKFWARWGDAVREAGLEPNEFKAAYDDETLLDCVAQLTREMGRLPAWSDLRVKAYSDQSFPSKDSFLRRFRSKEILVKMLLDHCRAKGGWDDVVALSEGYSPKKKREREPVLSAKAVQIGFV
jgi:hypothetical protein